MDQTPPPAVAKPLKVYHISGAKAALLWALSVLARAWSRTLRVQVDRAELARATGGSDPLVFVFWHNRLFYSPRLLRLVRPDRTVVALVSASRDGAVFSKFIGYLGVRTIRGSSSRLGREAVHGLIHELRTGHDVVVTPDGPRGPMYDMKPGPWLAARRARSAIVLVGVECHACWKLRSWDRFQIPWPFARTLVRLERIEITTLDEHPEPLAFLRARLVALNGDAAGDMSQGSRVRSQKTHVSSDN